MCHILADTPQELHEMAIRLGMRLEWFQPVSTPHYDICLIRRKKALELGAIEIDRHSTVALIRKIRNASDVDWSPSIER